MNAIRTATVRSPLGPETIKCELHPYKSGYAWTYDGVLMEETKCESVEKAVEFFTFWCPKGTIL